MSVPVAQARGGAAVGLPPGVLLGDLGRRAAAFGIDLALPVVLLVVALVVGSPLVWLVAGALSVAWWLVCASLFTSRAAGPGMLVLGLQVVALRNGRPLTFGRFLLRSLVLLGLTVTVVGLLIMVFQLVQQRRRQGWHDLVAGSVVIVRRALAPRRPHGRTATAPQAAGEPGDEPEREAAPEPDSPAPTAVHPAVEDEPRSVTTTGVLLTEDDVDRPEPAVPTGESAESGTAQGRGGSAPDSDATRSEPDAFDRDAEVVDQPGPASTTDEHAPEEQDAAAETPVPAVVPGPTGPAEPDVSEPYRVEQEPGEQEPGDLEVPADAGPAEGPGADEDERPADEAPDPAADELLAPPAEPAAVVGAPAPDDVRSSPEEEPVTPGPVAAVPDERETTPTGPLRLVLDDDRPLEPSPLTLLGRNPQPGPDEADAVVVKVRDQARTVSKLHLAIVVDATGSYVVDRESTNGSAVTTADGSYHLLTPEVRRRLAPGDVIAFGDHRITVRADG
ncbi:putative RDD family membrane protein YckC [Friedmanniella endophytica]|uniref:Putative RDD family membrane protein YckC n=1 Tax=Microlunatus kandeliicorticis TaxID=1759536 RepID=A0A7W3IQK9_9ACTN|nr:RDD family protein [Microlunatus kandeliicorticis]MBA8793418.1 putative RDD family membrane protein YckC [Microlunatus kandeliicorticis]